MRCFSKREQTKETPKGKSPISFEYWGRTDGVGFDLDKNWSRVADFYTKTKKTISSATRPLFLGFPARFCSGEGGMATVLNHFFVLW